MLTFPSKVDSIPLPLHHLRQLITFHFFLFMISKVDDPFCRRT